MASLGGSGRLATLRSTFLSFANFGRAGGATQLDTMDGNMWAKFCRETGLQNKRSLTPVQVDLIFSKVKDRGERRIDFEDFKDAVAMVAEMRRMSFAELTAIITAKGGPQNSGTMAASSSCTRSPTVSDSSWLTPAATQCSSMKLT